MDSNLPVKLPERSLPPILSGRETLAVRQKVEEFYLSIAEIFEAWVRRRQSSHTQRAYREDVMSFARLEKFKGALPAPLPIYATTLARLGESRGPLGGMRGAVFDLLSGNNGVPLFTAE